MARPRRKPHALWSPPPSARREHRFRIQLRRSPGNAPPKQKSPCYRHQGTTASFGRGVPSSLHAIRLRRSAYAHCTIVREREPSGSRSTSSTPRASRAFRQTRDLSHPLVHLPAPAFEQKRIAPTRLRTFQFSRGVRRCGIRTSHAASRLHRSRGRSPPAQSRCRFAAKRARAPRAEVLHPPHTAMSR